MKRTLFKGQKQPKLHQNKSEGCDLTSVSSPDFSTGVDEQQQTMTMIGGESESLHALPQSNYAEDNTTNCDMTQKKKEKLGIFRTLRRRFKTNFLKKSDESDSNHIEEYCQNSTTSVTVKGETKRHKQSARCKVNLCTKPSNSNSSHSSESLDLNIPIQRCKKVDEFQSNKDKKDLDLQREKASCKSKDISKFQGDSCCECVVETNVIDNSSRRCQKICNLNQSCVQIHSENHILGKYDRSTEKLNSQAPNDTGQKIGIQADSNGLSLMEPQKVWSLTQELFRLSKFGWYWGPITRREAERKLAGQPDGAFLVRDSSDERYLLSLSFRSYGRTLHTRIEHCNGKFIFDAQPDTEGYPSIVDLIENSMNDPQTGICSYSRRGSPSPPIYPVRLTKPVSRFTQVRSLQYLCRFVIRQYTRYDHIQELPLPNSIKGWIGENQYSS